MFINETKLIKIFCDCDDFIKAIPLVTNLSCAGQIGNGKREPTRVPSISISEIMCILILYHHSGMKCFQYYYKEMVLKQMLSYFPDAPSYSRFVELIPRAALPMFLFVNLFRVGEATGYYFADSKKLPVCDNLRIKSNRVFKGIAGRSKSSTGWFYGLKLFLVINQYGQVMNCWVTSANIADNNLDMMKRIFKFLKGMVFADKGFISQKAFEFFYQEGLKIVTTIRSNMKNKLMPMLEKVLRKKRGVIESVNDLLMTLCDIDHTRHRNPINALTHTLSGVAAYTYLDKLPSIMAKKFDSNL